MNAPTAGSVVERAPSLRAAAQHVRDRHLRRALRALADHIGNDVTLDVARERAREWRSSTQPWMGTYARESLAEPLCRRAPWMIADGLDAMIEKSKHVAREARYARSFDELVVFEDWHEGFFDIACQTAARSASREPK